MKVRRVLGTKQPEPVVSQPQPQLTPVAMTDLALPFKDVIDSMEVATSSTESPDKSPEAEPVVCPICTDEMVSLLQLNRHLDDEHGFGDSPTPHRTQSFVRPSSPLSPNDELRSWLRKTNEVKTKITTALPRKLVNLDLFDAANNSFSMSGDSRSSSSASVNTLEITVTRKHWQRPSGYDVCAQAGCKKLLNIKNGLVNCRKCGKLFCNAHTEYRARLSADAEFDHKGAWGRCCVNCFEERPGYKDYGGIEDLTSVFKQKRQRKIDERDLYQNKLEKRVVNLTAVIHKVNREYQSTEFNSNFLNFRIGNRKREVEQQLITWEDGGHVLNCFICMKNFTFTLRKHHCRICGRVVCADLETQCSMDVPIDHLTAQLDVPRVNDPSTIRMCRHCKDVLFLKRNFERDKRAPLTPLVQKFETQQNVKRAILVLMPRFQDILKRLQNDQNKSKKLTQEASKLRKRLVDSFALFDKLTKEVVALEGLTEDEQAIQMAVRTESASFIQLNMAPLKQLPQLLQKIDGENAKTVSKPKYTREQVSLIKRRRDELMVLQEQKFLVGEMISNCTRHRRFDELPTLQMNHKELANQIDRLQAELGDEGF